MFVQRIATEVFADEEELKELRIAPLHPNEPRERDDEKCRYTDTPMQAAKQFPIALNHNVDDQYQRRQHHTNQAFTQYRERHGDPHEDRPIALLNRRRPQILRG